MPACRIEPGGRSNRPAGLHPGQLCAETGAGTLSAMIDKCHHIIRVPTHFYLNVQIAGAVVMYDRIQSFGKFEDRPVMPGEIRAQAQAISPSGKGNN